MKNEYNKKCIVTTSQGDIKGTIINEYEEIGGENDGAIFAVIDLENGQLITVRMTEEEYEDFKIN